ncbi:MAG: ferritin [Tissierellia bacterium]|nr:ferritin [Tissierellia bacterium]
MKLSKDLLAGLNEQIAREYEAAYLYKAMEIYFDDKGIRGFQTWMKEQVKEELSHAQDFIDFILESGNEVKLRDLKLENQKFASIKDVFEKGVEHEEFITKSISDLLEIAIKDKAYAAENFLRTYVDEQMEEEDSFNNVLGLVKYVGEDKAAMFHADRFMGKRGQ